MLIAALDWNIKSWHAMMMHRKATGTPSSAWNSNGSSIPSSVSTPLSSSGPHHRRAPVAYTINLDRFFSAWATTERTRFGYG